jgi:hypothetical protein
MSLDTWFGIALTLGYWQRYSGSGTSSTSSSYESGSCNRRSGSDGEETPYDALANDACRQRAARSISAAPAARPSPGAPLDIRPPSHRRS